MAPVDKDEVLAISLGGDVLQRIRAQGAAEYPHECCGLLLGSYQGDAKRVVDIWPVENAWTAEASPGLSEAEDVHSLRDRFYIPPKAYLQADRAARRQDLEIVGCYHSHPDDLARPSERDRVGASGVGGGQSFSFLVLSVRDSVPGELTSWLLSDDGSRWLPEDLNYEESASWQ
jgi:proteasome lid subunit RPN8/RPN11